MKYSNLAEILSENALEEKGITFIANDRKEKFITYRELLENSRRVLHGLNAWNIEAGDQIIFQIADNENYIYLMWACLLGKLIAIPMPIAINAEQQQRVVTVRDSLERAFVLTDLREEDTSNHVINVNGLDLEEEGEILKCDANDIAVIQYSSGSTGNPKGVILTHENILATIKDMAIAARVVGDDSFFSWMPITHDFGLIAFHFLPMYNRCSQYQMGAQAFLKDPIFWIECLDKYRITITATPNFGLKHVIHFGDFSRCSNLDLSCVRLICNGAEPISYQMCEAFLQKLAPYQLKHTVMLPVYGMAEAGLAITIPVKANGVFPIYINRQRLGIGQKVVFQDEETTENGLTLVKVGEPVEGCELRICDNNDSEVSDCVIGHIQIRGKNVTKGYYNDDSLTEGMFTVDGWLKTGDLGFIFEEQLVITGRAKDVIFSNGQNYYSYDIERCLQTTREFPIPEVAVTSVRSEGIAESIVAFVKYEEEIPAFVKESQYIKQYAMKEIGIIIDHVIPINEIPKTQSGKVMYYKLKDMFESGHFNDVLKCLEGQKNKTETKVNMDVVEKKLEALWKNVLGKEYFYREASFIENGGDSIKSAIICNKVKAQFQTEISVKDLIDGMKFDEMYKRIQKGENAKCNLIEHCKEQEYYPLSYEQQRIFAASYIGQNKIYNISCGIKVMGKVDIERFEDAFQSIIKRHEILRTSFHLVDGVPKQKVHQNVPFKIDVVRYTGELEVTLNAHIKVFNLDEESLFQVTAFIEKQSETTFLLNMHHIVSDGTSIGNILDELKSCFAEETLPGLEYQYKDYILWQQNSWGEEIEIEEKYWLNLFREAPQLLDMPLDYRRPSTRTYSGKKIEFDLDAALSVKINEYVKQINVTLFTYLFSAYSILLQKYTGQDDITIGTTMAGRDNFEFDKNIGMFVNLLPIRTNPCGKKKFSRLLSEVKNSILLGYSNQKYPYNVLAKKLNMDDHNGRNPIFDTVFQMRNFYLPSYEIGNMNIKEISFDNHVSMFDFKLEAIETEHGIHFVLEYSTELFTNETMERFSQRYISVLEQLIQDGDMMIQDIGIRSENEMILLHKLKLDEKDAISFSFI